MWTTENRGRYDRSKLRYPSDVTDAEWAIVGPLIPPAKRGGNKRTVNVREVVNGVMYVLSTGCRWGDLPRGPQWATKSAAHRWLQRWQADGTLAAMQARLLGLAEERGMIQWRYGAVDGSFSPWQRRR